MLPVASTPVAATAPYLSLLTALPRFPHVSVGIIPTGTGNDWIRNFDHPSAFRQIGAQVEATATPIDLIRANQHYALNMLNIGFDCNVVYAASQLKKRPFLQGPLAYIAGIMQELCHPMGTRLHIALENEEPLSGEFLLCTIANGSFCGGGFQSSPRAQINDELLDIAVIQKVSRLTLSFSSPFLPKRPLFVAAGRHRLALLSAVPPANHQCRYAPSMSV